MKAKIDQVRLRKYEDKRGVLIENTVPEIVSKSKHFFVSISKPNIIRGNHYHLKKSEWFYLIEGKCKLRIIDLKTKKKNDITISSTDNLIIHIGPNQAHAFKNIGKGKMILLALVNVPHDQNKPDTYPYTVIK